MPLIPKRQETSFGYGKQASLVETLFHVKENLKEAVADQMHFCNAQLAYCYADKHEEYTHWIGYY